MKHYNRLMYLLTVSAILCIAADWVNWVDIYFSKFVINIVFSFIMGFLGGMAFNEIRNEEGALSGYNVPSEDFLYHLSIESQKGTNIIFYILFASSCYLITYGLMNPSINIYLGGELLLIIVLIRIHELKFNHALNCLLGDYYLMLDIDIDGVAAPEIPEID